MRKRGRACFSADSPEKQARPLFLLLVLALTAAMHGHVALAQQRLLTIDDIYGSGGGRFGGSAAARLTFLDNPWVDDGHYLWPGDDVDVPWLRVDALSGASQPLFDRQKLVAALAAIPGLPRAAAGTAPRRPTNFNPRHDGFLITIGDDLFYYDIAGNIALRLTSSPGAKRHATFSPDGKSVAFVSGNNLYVTDIGSTVAARKLTTDGGPDVTNGTLDWVYTEELFGRGNDRGFWWSPDSAHIVFLHLDDRRVPVYPLVNDLEYHPQVETMRYPKAGDPNPIARLGVVSKTEPGSIHWVDTSKYADFLIVDAGWSSDGQSVAYQVQDRRQRWLDFNLADRAGGNSTTLFRETGPAWVERWDDSSADPIWLKDGSFLWLSERSGFRHLYHYTRAGALINQLTSGDWEVRSVDGVDESAGWIYFSGTERSVLGRDVYRVKLDGTGRQLLSAAPATHRAIFNPGATLFLDSRSDVVTPPQARLHRADGTELRVRDAGPVPALTEYRLSKPEFLQVSARDGFQMEAMMIKPPDFDPSKRYPVYQYEYGGPHIQSVVNEWGYSEYLYHQLLAQRGIIVWICDHRTASGKGARSTMQLAGAFGALELRDMEDCAGWLRQQPYVDASRMGVYGYSFGGYLAAYAMTHPSGFSMGIAGAPVTDWRNYDTIYTERYLGLPRENPDGYLKSSPRFNAADLHGDLLLIHDAGDDNVHLQNTMQLARELQRAGKSFQMMIYPSPGHGEADPALLRHERQTMLDFTIRALRP
jgi:dipeptidyl-peptidase-4